MNRFAVAAAATALMIGAGAGALATISAPAPEPSAETMNPMVDGQAMLATLDIAGNVTVSPQHTVLAVYLEETGLDATLKGKGPVTLFAPTDKAFSVAGNLGSRAEVARLVLHHVVHGRVDSKALLEKIGEAGGRATLKTLDGGTLVASLNGPTNIFLTDERGETSNIAIYDIYSRNGVIHVIDRVLKPLAIRKPSPPVMTSSAQ